MRKYKKRQMPFRPDFRFRKSRKIGQLPDFPRPRPRRIRRTLIVFGSLAAINVAAALVNPWIGIFTSFFLGPAYIIIAIVLAVYAFSEPPYAESDIADDRKTKKTRFTIAGIALILIIAVVAFLLLLNEAVNHIDFR